MIFTFTAGDPDTIVRADLAAEFPVYLYVPPESDTALYSRSLVDLLERIRTYVGLSVNADAVAFLLQSGVVPPPLTIYRDLYVIGVGDQVTLRTSSGKAEVDFQESFPFKSCKLPSNLENQPNVDGMLELLAEAVTQRQVNHGDSFLFHSAGKDSNTIALALAEAGMQSEFTLLCQKSSHRFDESAISKEVAKKLGFKHRTLPEHGEFNSSQQRLIRHAFERSPFPCADNVSLAYPMYVHALPELSGANVIDGGGNDIYMLAPPSARDLQALRLFKYTGYISWVRNFMGSATYIDRFIRTPAERFGLDGLSPRDSDKIYPCGFKVYKHWLDVSKDRANWDCSDFKTSVLAAVVASESHIRKVRNFADAFSANVIFPFSNESVAEWFLQLPVEKMVDRESFRNKVILRDLLHSRLGLNSDQLGKMGFAYNPRRDVLKNWEWMESEIKRCHLWDSSNLDGLLQSLYKKMISQHRYADFAARLLHRLFLISGWHNYSRYLSLGSNE